jgi:uncharacterized protein (UPF0333 family)
MHGRTKSFFEDVFVVVVLIVAAVGVYYLFFYSSDDLQSSHLEIETVKTTSKEQITNKIDESKEKSLKEDTKTVIATQKELYSTENNQTNASQIVELKKEEIKEEVKIVKEEIDLKFLQQFIDDTKHTIKEKIVHKIFKEGEKSFLSIRVTILKNGSYEQFTFVDGNKKIFDLNKKEIVTIFPLIIDPKIAGDFPRYLRYRFEFSDKEQ